MLDNKVNVRFEENKRVLFLSAANDIHTVRWVNALAKEGIEVHLAFCSDHSPKVDKIDEKIYLHPLKVKSPFGYYLNQGALKKICHSIKPALINAHYASGYGTLMRLCNYRPALLSIWGSDVYEFPYRNKYNMRLINKNIRYADQISSTSNIMAEQIKRISECYDNQITIVPFGVDLSLFKRNKPYSSKHNGKIRIGIVKRLKPNYGIDLLIRAFAIVIDGYKQIDNIYDISLDIYGDGPQQEDLLKLINKLKLVNHVRLLGDIPNIKVPEVLETLDLYVLASYSESFGVSAVEAMAMGVPIVATDAEGFREVLDNGKYGIIVPRGNVESLAKAILELIGNNKLRDYYSKISRTRVEKLYNWQDNVNSMIKLYSYTVNRYNDIVDKNEVQKW
ncbi:MAG: glycosyltransferase [Peptococcia bacterium]